MTLVEIPQAIQVVRQCIAIGSRQPVFLNHSSQRGHDIAKLPFIVSTLAQLPLQFIELDNCSL